jgi:hypothetical protein
LAGASHAGVPALWTTVPSAFLSWNFAGTVLAALKTLVRAPV